MKIIKQCTKNKGRIVVFGDKDPDGIFSSMMVTIYLERLMLIYRKESFLSGNIGVDIRYSNREKDGFGLSKETYDVLSAKYDLIITTDNGTSSTFHSPSIENLIVIDHHPLNRSEELPYLPYIFNPNVWRKDGLEYSTSGGIVAYDVIRFIDKVLREKDTHFQKYLRDAESYHAHELMLEVLKEFAGFTLISDMAILDAYNRRFVQEAFQTASMKEDRMPLYTLFKDKFNQRSFSFNIAPKINIDRMGELHTIDTKTDKTYMENFIRPKSKEDFLRAQKFILSVDEKKKEIVRILTEKMKQNLDHSKPVHLVWVNDPNAKIGLGGLIANKLFQKYGKPVIVAIATSDNRKLSFSARGSNVKEILSSILPNSGGHADACGGSLEVSESIEESFNEVKQKLETLESLPKASKKALIHTQDAPMSMDECLDMLEVHQDISKGVETKEKLLVAVKEPNVLGSFAYKNNYGKVSFGKDKRSKEVFVDFSEFEEAKIKEAKIVVFELIANGDLAIHAIYEDTKSYLADTVEHEEIKDFTLASEINSLAIEEIERVKREDVLHRFTPDLVSDKVFYYKNEEDIDYIIEDTLIVIPSYIKMRHPMRKREDTLEFFIGEDENTPVEASHFSVYKEFSNKMLYSSKNKNMILMPEGMLNHPLLDEKIKKIVRLTIQNISKQEKKENDTSIKTDMHIQHGHGIGVS